MTSTDSNNLTKQKNRFRSPNGTNRIYRDGNRYKLKSYIDLPDGRRVTFVGSGKTRSICQANTQRLMQKKLAQIEATLPNRQLLADYCERWIEDVKSIQGLKPRTLAAYRAAVRNHIRPFSHGLSLAETNRESIQGIYAHLQKLGKTYYSLKDVRAVLCGALDEAVSSGTILLNPARTVRLPRKPKIRPVHFTQEEVKKILDAAVYLGEEARWSVAFLLGLRQGECLGLTWDCVELDSEDPHLNVCKTLTRVTGKGLVVGEPKTTSSNRIVPLSTEIVEILRHHRLIQKEALFKSGIRWRETTAVFATPKGTAMDPANDRKAWIRLLKTAGVPFRKLHAARHTTATIMHANNVPLLTISHILGHSSIATTAEFYAHVETETKRKAILTLEKAIST